MNKLLNTVVACLLSTVVESGAYADTVQSYASPDAIVVARANTALVSGMVKTSSLANTPSRSRDMLTNPSQAASAEEPTDLDTMALLAGLVLVLGIAIRRLRA